jgi:DNA polymerase-3 subunit alpha
MKESKLKFVGLHAHSCAGSPFDALGYPGDHMDYAHENGMNALALTDHGNMNGLSWQVEHAKKMLKEGKNFKPIFGCEAYYIPSIDVWHKDYEHNKEKKKEKVKGIIHEDDDKHRQLITNAHFLLLAKNQKGLNNLFKLISDSYLRENFYRKPRIDLKALRKYSEGLIATTTCISGPFAKIVWQNPELGHFELLDIMRPMVEQFLEIFGHNYYGEVQWNNIPEQHKLNKCIIDLSKEYDIKLISTVDSHYARPELWRDRELYKRLGWLGASKKPEWLSDEIPDDVDKIGYELYPKNGDQVFESYIKYSKECDVEYDPDVIAESIENTYALAHNEIENFLPDSTVRLPNFVVPEDMTADEALGKYCIAGLKTKAEHKQTREYVKRLCSELKIIKSRGFSKYFLTMKAIADKAVESQITGPGRGSAAGSLVAYTLGITQVDPIKYGLLFSRFLREDAKDYPDIDYDVSEPMVLKEKLIEEWGSNVVVPISNWNTLQLRSLIKDIAKFYNVPFQEVNHVTGVMLDEATPPAKMKNNIRSGVYTPTFDEVKEFSPTLRVFLEDYPQVKVHIDELYGQVRSCSRHAGGVVVGEDLDKHMPLINSRGVRQTPWSEGQNVRHLEPLGFIKFDVLGLASLRMIESAIKKILTRQGTKEPTFNDIKDFYNKNLHPDTMDLNDQKVYKNIFHDGRWAGVFQFTEEGAQAFCERAMPTSIVDIAAITSIFRPGPLAAKVDNRYIDTKEGTVYREYPHQIVKEVTSETHGFLIFQEQIALLAHLLGDNISLDEGNKLRKLLTKKGTGQTEEEKDKIRDKFFRGCDNKGITSKGKIELWKNFEYFSGYGFNKSHAISYSLLSFQCAYLLNYYPIEWMAAFLDKEPETRKQKAISIAKGAGFDISPVDINTSDRDWAILNDHTLVQPLSSIKGLGDKAIDEILEHRPFTSVEDLIFRKGMAYSKLNKRSLDVLIRAAAMNELMDERFDGAKHFWSAVSVIRPKTKKALEKNIEAYREEGDFSVAEKIEHQTELTGMYPFDLVMPEDLHEFFQRNMTPPLSKYDEALGEAWFIVRSVTNKVTKNNRSFCIIECIDPFGENIIRCWGAKIKKGHLLINKVYTANLVHSSRWGFSIKDVKENMKRIS